VIVGLPLEKPDLVTEAMINYYEARFRRGWDYAYIYPAVIKAQQAAGRAIRSEKDRAVIVYMDKRYLWANYRKCFPPETRFVVCNEPSNMIKRFFSTNSKADAV
jgi:DNA excision repair protein ERCC-2